MFLCLPAALGFTGKCHSLTSESFCVVTPARTYLSELDLTIRILAQLLLSKPHRIFVCICSFTFQKCPPPPLRLFLPLDTAPTFQSPSVLSLPP